MKVLSVVFLIFGLAACGKDKGSNYFDRKSGEVLQAPPLAYCENLKLGIYGESIRTVGPHWTYTYRGQKYEGSLFESINGEGEIYYFDETVISKNESFRMVTLRRSNGPAVVTAQVHCKGDFLKLNEIE